jgi:hypothetical protein
MTRSKADLVELIRADRLVQIKRASRTIFAMRNDWEFWKRPGTDMGLAYKMRKRASETRKYLERPQNHSATQLEPQ